MLVVAGLAVLLWPLSGRDLRSTAAYPNYTADCSEPFADCYRDVALIPNGLVKLDPAADAVVRDRRSVAAVLVLGAGLVLVTDPVVRRRGG